MVSAKMLLVYLHGFVLLSKASAFAPRHLVIRGRISSGTIASIAYGRVNGSYDPPPDIPFNNEKVQGIGGDGGLVYDVNRLKRNLVQETMREYKEDLLSFLLVEGCTEQEIVDKFSALVQASPVRTTTDSNLLDGTWWLAFESKQSWVSDLLDLERARLLLRRKSKTASKAVATSLVSSSSSSSDIPINTRLEIPYNGNQESTWKQTKLTYMLEDLKLKEHPYVIDETAWAAGMFRKTRRSTVTGLTRRTMKTAVGPPQWSLLGQPVFRKFTQAAASNNKSPPQDIVEIIYLDVDLCILAHGEVPADEIDKRPFAVYTKDPSWPVGRIRQKLIWCGEMALRILLPFWKRGGKKKRPYTTSGEEIMMLRQEADPIVQEFDVHESKLRVLKLGDLRDQDDEAWDGLADPFVHLTADERQEVLKQMNMRQIAQAGNKKLATSQRERWFQRVFGRRKRFFKRVEKR